MHRLCKFLGPSRRLKSRRGLLVESGCQYAEGVQCARGVLEKSLAISRREAESYGTFGERPERIPLRCTGVRRGGFPILEFAEGQNLALILDLSVFASLFSEEVLEHSRVFGGMTVYVRDSKNRSSEKDLVRVTQGLPFTFAIHFMLGKCDILVVDNNAKVECSLSEIIIRCPLHKIHSIQNKVQSD